MKRKKNVLFVTIMALMFCLWCCVAVQASYGTSDTTKFGDVDGNGQINEEDTRLIQQHIAAKKSNEISQKHPDWILRNQAAIAADVNANGVIDSTDLLIVMRHAANKISRIITVKFDTNGGDMSLDNIPVIYSLSQSTYYPLLKECSRRGYNFDGWYTSPYGGTKVSSYSTVTQDKDHTLYAHWSSQTIKITFDAMGGTFNESDKKDVLWDSVYGQLPRPRKMGYCFEGWYTSAYGGYRVYSSSAVAYNYSHTLYARWSMKQYTQPQEGRITGRFSEDSGSALYYKLVLPEDGTINIDSTASFPQSIKIWSVDSGTWVKYYTSLPQFSDIYTTLSLKSGTYYLCLEVLDGYGYKYGNYNLVIVMNKIQRILTLDKTSASLYKNETLNLNATAIGMNGNISWKSSNPAVAQVDSHGKVTAKKKWDSGNCSFTRWNHSIL